VTAMKSGRPTLAFRVVMRRNRRPALALALAAALTLLVAPAALANSFQNIFKEYQRTGRIDGCKHSQKELQSAKSQVPNDIVQYAPDFPAALSAAIEQRASGACSKKHAATAPAAQATPSAPSSTPPANGGSTPAPSSTPSAPAQSAPAQPAQTPAPPATPKPAPAVADNAIPAAAHVTRTSGGSHAPAPLVLLAILGGLLALAAATWGGVRWWAWDPAWAVRARHAGSEAGWRASAAWAEFSDWLRLGR